MPTAQLRVLLLPRLQLKRDEDGGLVEETSAQPGWVAVCLDHYIVGDGETLEDAVASLVASVRAEILRALEERCEPLADNPPAPDRYHQMWRSAKLGEPISIERPQAATGPDVIQRVAISAETRVAA